MPPKEVPTRLRSSSNASSTGRRSRRGSEPALSPFDFAEQPKIKQLPAIEWLAIVWFFVRLPFWWLLWFCQALPNSQRPIKDQLANRTVRQAWESLSLAQLRAITKPEPLRLTLARKRFQQLRRGVPNYNRMFAVPKASARWITEAKGRTRDDPVILYLHGGAFFLKTSPQQIEWLLHTAKAVAGTRASILAVDYTVTPYAKFPAQLHETLAVYLELLNSCDNVIVVGDSAGGTLALSLCSFLKHKANVPPPAALLLSSPTVDLAPGPPGVAPLQSYIDYDKFDMVSAPMLTTLFSLYCNVNQLNDPLVNPVMGTRQFWDGALPKHTRIVYGGLEVASDEIAEFAKTVQVEAQSVPMDTHDSAVLGDWDRPAAQLFLSYLLDYLPEPESHFTSEPRST